MNSILNALYGSLLVLPFAFVGALVGALLGIAGGYFAGHWMAGGSIGAAVGALVVGGFALFFLMNYASPQ